jgi:hypothetical protein
LILTQKNGKPKLLIENGAAGETTVQLHYYLRGLLKNVDIIDANGAYFSHVATSFSGINWSLYRSIGVLGFLLLPLEILFGVVMVRVTLKFEAQPVLLELQEIKDRIASLIESNPDAYTHAPPEEIVQRIKRAKSIRALINSISKD